MSPMVLGLLMADRLGIPTSKLLGLAKFQGLTAESLTPAVLVDMASLLGFEHPDTTALAGLATEVVVAKPTDVFAFLGEEDRFKRLITAVKGQDPAQAWKCPHCGLLSYL